MLFNLLFVGGASAALGQDKAECSIYSGIITLPAVDGTVPIEKVGCKLEKFKAENPDKCKAVKYCDKGFACNIKGGDCQDNDAEITKLTGMKDVKCAALAAVGACTYQGLLPGKEHIPVGVAMQVLCCQSCLKDSVNPVTPDADKIDEIAAAGKLEGELAAVGLPRRLLPSVGGLGSTSAQLQERFLLTQRQLKADLIGAGLLGSLLNGTTGECQPCSEHHYCEAESLAPTTMINLNQCPEGSYCPASTEKIICPEGFYCPEGTQNGCVYDA
jgi:hypothetical protein